MPYTPRVYRARSSATAFVVHVLTLITLSHNERLRITLLALVLASTKGTRRLIYLDHEDVHTRWH